MPSNSYGEAGSAGGASGSVDFGQATSLRDQMNKATAGTQGPTGEPARAGGGAPPQQAGEGPGGPASQPPPPPADQGAAAAPRSPYSLPQPFPEPAVPWRRQLRDWANHPNAGPAIKRLAELANRGGA